MKKVHLKKGSEKKFSPVTMRIAKALAPTIRDMINDPNLVFSRPDPTGTARLAQIANKE